MFNDLVNETAAKFQVCDGLVVGSPVYYASANATLVAFLTRLFYSTHFDKTMKVGAAVVAARRGGLSSAFDELNKFFTISGMPVASSQYWNSIHGREPGEAAQDAEGLQTMRTLARMRPFKINSPYSCDAGFPLIQAPSFCPYRDANISSIASITSRICPSVI